MRLTLWQQFSSNHSSSALIVGTFKTAADAQQVADEIRLILVKVARNREQLRSGEIIAPPDCDPNDGESLIPVELTLREEYGLKSWQRTIYYAQDSASVTQAVRVIDRHIAVAEAFLDLRTWTGSIPFAELMRQFGAAVLEETINDSPIECQITCIAPDDATAERLMQSIKVRSRTIARHVLHEIAFPPETKQYMRGRVVRDGLQFTFAEIRDWFGRFQRVTALAEFLTASGCQAVEYHFEQKD